MAAPGPVTFLLHAFPGLAAACTVLWIGRWIFFRSTGIDPARAILIDRNPAAGLFSAGFLLALAVALGGTFYGRFDRSPGLASLEILGEGLLVLGLLRAALAVQDRFLLPRFHIREELIRDANLGVAAAMTGAILASGLVLNGTLTGHSPTPLRAVIDLLVCFLLGQFVLVAAGRLFFRFSRHHLERLLEVEDHLPAGIRLGALLVSLGLIVRASLLRTGLVPPLADLAWFAASAGCGTLLLLALGAALETGWKRLATLEDEADLHHNLAAACLAAGTQIALATLIASALSRP